VKPFPWATGAARNVPASGSDVRVHPTVRRRPWPGKRAREPRKRREHVAVAGSRLLMLTASYSDTGCPATFWSYKTLYAIDVADSELAAKRYRELLNELGQ
jgi:hypothetical protein